MTDKERAYFVETILSRLNLANFGVEQTVDVQEAFQEVTCSIDGFPVLVFLVTADKVEVIKTTEPFQETKDYSFTSKLGLFIVLVTLLWNVYAPFIKIASFFSIVLGYQVNTWVSLLVRICTGLDFQIERIGDKIKLDNSVIEVKDKHVYYKGVINVDVEYDTTLDLCVAVLGFLNYELQNQELDIIVFDDVDEEEEGLVQISDNGMGSSGGFDDSGDFGGFDGDTFDSDIAELPPSDDIPEE